MGFARVLATLTNDTLLPEDEFVNTWYFNPPGAVSSSATDITNALNTFYQAIDGLLGSQITGSIDFSVYDLEDAAPRVPVVVTPGTLMTPAANALPNELAVCLSFQGALASGQSQARRRGRVFLGPLGQSVASSSVSGDVRVAAASRTTICTAADALMSTAGITWSVFSPTTAGGEPWESAALTAAFTPVTNGWVDDAFDIQRRRGLNASTRTTFS